MPLVDAGAVSRSDQEEAQESSIDMDMIDKIQKLVPVPEAPIDTDESGLKRTFKALGISKLPADYLEYARIYGSGTIVVEVYDWEIYSPFRRTYPEFVQRFFEREDAYRKAAETESLGLGLFPEPGGLLPFGHRDDVYFCWKTEGKPESWKTVVLWLYEEGGFQTFNLKFAEFLLALLTRKITVAGFNSPWNPKTDISFEPEVFGG